MEKIITEGTKIYLALEPVDMRKGFNGLYAQVSEQLKLKPLSGALFVFTNKTRTRVKILHWDGSGLWVMAKRLEEGRFSWPKSAGPGNKLVLGSTALRMLLDGDYLQIDETPIKVIDPDYPNNKTRSGWLWPISRPTGDVVFTWSMTRGSSHLDELLAGFSGYLQSDAYGVYDKYAREREGIVLSACMAHIRRQFDKAKEQSQDARRVLAQIAPLYRIEKELREAGADHAQIERTRQAESLPILEDLQKQLIKVRQAHLPKSLTGKACDYALSIWDKAKVYCQRGDLQIDNNLIENAIRPSAIGKKNWLFVGHPNAGKRSAIIYSIVISCQRHGICPGQYHETVLADQNLLRRQDPTGLTPAEMAPQF